MAYVTTLKVAADTGRTFTATSTPNIDQVQGFVNQTAAELDSILRRLGYTVPIATAATSALALLEGYNALGAGAFALQAAVTPGGKKPDAMRLWQDAKKMLADGKLELDAARDPDRARPRGRSSFPATAMFSRNVDV